MPVLLSRAALLACSLVATWTPPASDQSAVSPRCPVLGSDTLAPSRAAFMLELIDSRPSARTPRFDDYTDGSYHVEKATLVRDLATVAARCGARPLGLVVVGPVGPLWSYYVLAFFGAGDSVRMNTLVMPHARITGKGTASLPLRVWIGLLDSLRASQRLRPGLPACTQAAGGDSSLACEFSYDVQVTAWGSGVTQWHAAFGIDGSTAFERFVRPINAVLEAATATYEHPGLRR